MYLVIQVTFDWLGSVCERIAQWAWEHTDPVIRAVRPPASERPAWRQRGSEK